MLTTRRNLTIALVLAAALVAGCTLLQAPRPAPQHASPPMGEGRAADDRSISVTWIGHATVLIRMRDRWFLTDPVFGDRIARIYPRKVEAAMQADELPPLDAVLISHAHFDHLYHPSLRQLDTAGVLVIPSGAAEFLPGDLEVGEIAALDTWESVSRDGVTLTAVPALHGQGRYLVDRWNHDTFAGWVIEYDGLTVYFAGDTGYSRGHAEELDRRFDIDVALIPVGPAGRAAWIESWRADVHATPEHAMELFAASGAQWMVPIHFGTFFEPAGKELPIVERAVASHPRGGSVRILAIGETTEFLY